jgi:hypothetical protein
MFTMPMADASLPDREARHHGTELFNWSKALECAGSTYQLQLGNDAMQQLAVSSRDSYSWRRLFGKR